MESSGRCVVDDVERLPARAGYGLDPLLHRQDPVDGRLERTGHLGDHVGHRLQVLVVDEALAGRRRDLDQLRAAAPSARPSRAPQSGRSPSTLTTAAPDRAAARAEPAARVVSSWSRPASAPSRATRRVRTISLRGDTRARPPSRGRSWISQLGPGSSTYQSTSTTPGVRLEDLPHLAGEPTALVEIRTVDLGHQRREHRRARRHLGHLDVGAGAARPLERAARAPAWRAGGLRCPGGAWRAG